MLQTNQSRSSTTMWNSGMLTATGFLLLMLFGNSKSLSNTRCFPLNEGGSTCFTQPDPLVALSWSSAMEWCKNFGGTLPIPDTNYHNVVYGNALGYFGLYTETMWLGANFTYDLDNWFWTNGSSFTGTLESRNSSGKTHAYIVRNGTNVKLVAAAPADPSGHICQYPFSEVSCTNYQNSYWTSEKCNIKYKYSYSWYSYRSSCGQKNLASIDNLNDFSRWLDDLQPFWIGLRCSWWTWHSIVTGNSYEVIETQFGYLSILPEDTAQCLASYKDYNGYVRWTNLDCNSNLPFICQHDVNVTTTTSTTVVTTPTFNTGTTTSTFTTTATSPSFNTETTLSTSATAATSPTLNTETTISASNAPATSPTFNTETTRSTYATSATTHGTDWAFTNNPTSSRTTVPQGETWTSNRPTQTASITSSQNIKSESHSVNHDVNVTTTATTPSPATTSSTSKTVTNASTARTTSDLKLSTTPTDSLTTTTEGVTATSSIQTTNITSSPKVTNESNSGYYGLAVGLGVVGGLLLLTIASLALLTVYVYKTIRHTTKISPT